MTSYGTQYNSGDYVQYTMSTNSSGTEWNGTYVTVDWGSVQGFVAQHYQQQWQMMPKTEEQARIEDGWDSDKNEEST